MKRRFFLTSALVTASLSTLSVSTAVAADNAKENLEITDAFARASPKMAMAGAGFLTIRSLGTADRLTGFTTSACERPELHTHIKDEGGIMRMRQVEAIDVPAGGEAKLEPGGLHLMLIKLTDQLVEGSEIEVTLMFENAGEVTISLPVKGPGAMH